MLPSRDCGSSHTPPDVGACVVRRTTGVTARRRATRWAGQRGQSALAGMYHGMGILRTARRCWWTTWSHAHARPDYDTLHESAILDVMSRASFVQTGKCLLLLPLSAAAVCNVKLQSFTSHRLSGLPPVSPAVGIARVSSYLHSNVRSRSVSDPSSYTGAFAQVHPKASAGNEPSTGCVSN